LIRRPHDSAKAAKEEIAQYSANVDGIRSAFAPTSTIVPIRSNQMPKKMEQDVITQARTLQTAVAKGERTSPLKLIILGPPAGGKGTACEVIKQQYNVVHLSTGDILRDNIKNQTELGKKVKPFMDNGQLVPDELIIDMIMNRLNENDCKTRGWLLDGFPRTGSQAEAMVKKGVLPDAVIVLEVQDKAIEVRMGGRRTDPVTSVIYHMVFNPPPTEEIKNRLVIRDDDTLDKIKVRLETYYKHANDVMKRFAGLLKFVDANGDAKAVGQAVTRSIDGVLGVPPKPKVTDPLKLIILGPPAGGKGTCCEVIKQQYNVVHLSTGDILRENIKNQTPLGLKVKPFMDNGQLVPDELIIDLVTDRLQQQDCQTRGWLLDGFPRTPSQSQFMVKKGILPDAVIVLKVDDKAIEVRMGGRRTDPVTGVIYHVVFNPPPTEEIKNRLVIRDDDTPDKIKVRLSTYYKHANEVTGSFKGLTRDVDGNGDAKLVGRSVIRSIDDVLHKKSSRGVDRVVWKSETGVVQLPQLPLKLIILGPPAGGKGTACEVIKQQYNVIHLSTGDILRENISKQTLLGSQVRPYMEKGLLVPDELIIDMVTERLAKDDCKERGWLLDGFPRTGKQAAFMISKEIYPDAVICLNVEDKQIEIRMGGRRTDPVTGTIYHMVFNPPPTEEIKNRLVTRPDDTIDKIKVRLDTYYKHANDVMSQFPGAIKHIDGNVEAKVVGLQVISVVDQLL
jgi:adenylate kinase